MNDASSAEKVILAYFATANAVQTAPVVDEKFETIANELEQLRQKVCPYPYDEKTCDCKYGIGYGVNVRVSEKTGCPELREIITIYRGAARGFPTT